MELKIDGMSCMHCVMHVKNAILKSEGVTDLDVQIGKASFKLQDSSKLDEIKTAIQDAGYQVL